MQVMPFHAGRWKQCPSRDLADIDSNICYGTAILEDFVKRSPTLERALLRYNGCVRGANTPRCHTYSGKVLGYAERAASQMLKAPFAGLTGASSVWAPIRLLLYVISQLHYRNTYLTDWIGSELEQLRKLRGLRREDVAAQLTVPVSPSTIRNIEHDETYNVSLDLLRQIAAVLGAEVRVTLDLKDDTNIGKCRSAKEWWITSTSSATSARGILTARSPIRRSADGCGASRSRTARS